jgi:hypothetical protein
VCDVPGNQDHAWIQTAIAVPDSRSGPYNEQDGSYTRWGSRGAPLGFDAIEPVDPVDGEQADFSITTQDWDGGAVLYAHADFGNGNQYAIEPPCSDQFLGDGASRWEGWFRPLWTTSGSYPVTVEIVTGSACGVRASEQHVTASTTVDVGRREPRPEDDLNGPSQPTAWIDGDTRLTAADADGEVQRVRVDFKDGSEPQIFYFDWESCQTGASSEETFEVVVPDGRTLDSAEVTVESVACHGGGPQSWTGAPQRRP